MLFNSIPFLIFFAAFFFVYWFVAGTVKIQNFFVLIGSYVFYAWWDWRFVLLLAGSSLLHYTLGIYIQKTGSEGKKKFLLWTGLVQGIGVLVFYKYANIFIDSLPVFPPRDMARIILPLGLSFYTFRLMGYLLDVYHGKFCAVTDWVVFFSFVAFFPSLVSGPIDKAKTLIPQLEKKRGFTYGMATNGMRQLLWGFFKKIVIANNCALLVNPVFENYLTVPGSLLLAGAFLYAIQLYADFSGYSDMALGIARLLGFSITRNFHFPFFSKNIAEYWQKWHISLTSWFTEYVFTPLSIAFRDYGKFGLILAIIINFTIVGAWHGANWTFVLFGFLHGCYFIPLVLQGKMMRSKRTKNTNSHSVNSILSMAGTFTLVALTLIVFRADSVSQALGYFQRLFSVSLFFMPAPVDKKIALITGMLVLFFLCVEWLGQKNEYAIERVGVRWPAVFRWGFYYLLLIMVLVANEGAQDFIYARF